MVLPKSMRLKGYKSFNHLHKFGYRYYGSSMVLRVVQARPQLLKESLRSLKPQSCRCAVVISSKVSKKAVIRNKLRRLLHDHLSQRLCHNKGLSSKWALVSLKPSAINKAQTPLLEECDILLREAGLFS